MTAEAISSDGDELVGLLYGSALVHSANTAMIQLVHRCSGPLTDSNLGMGKTWSLEGGGRREGRAVKIKMLATDASGR